MNVTLTDIFQAEIAALDMFKAHDLERFIERTKKGKPIGFAQRIAVIGLTPDDAIVGCAMNGEAACEFVWKGEDVLFTRAFSGSTDPDDTPQWLKDLVNGDGS